MVDPGPQPYSGDFKMVFVHMLQVNIKGDDLSTGNVIVPYFGPSRPTTAASAYTLVVYEQSSMFDASGVASMTTFYQTETAAPSLFSTQKFATTFASTIGAQPIAMDWMHVAFDAYNPYRAATVQVDNAGTLLSAYIGNGCANLCGNSTTCTGSLPADGLDAVSASCN